MDILLEASRIVNGPRKKNYGDPKLCWERTARIASGLTGLNLTPEICIKILIAAKFARDEEAYKEDNLTDIAGYTWVLNEIKKGNKWKR